MGEDGFVVNHEIIQCFRQNPPQFTWLGMPIGGLGFALTPYYHTIHVTGVPPKYTSWGRIKHTGS